MDVGKSLSIETISSKPRKVVGWLYTLTMSISVLLIFTVLADTSLEEL